MTRVQVTANLGGTASNIVVGKVAVRPNHCIQLDNHLTASVIAWSYVDDASIKVCCL